MEEQPIQISIALMTQSIQSLDANMEKMIKIMQGDGEQSPGVVTRVALLKGAVTRLWWAIGSMTTLFGIIIAVLKMI